MPSVLIADDERTQREILGELLTLHGYQVRTAASPRALLQQLFDPPEALLLDVVGMLCPPVVRALKGVRPRPRLILVSGERGTPELLASVQAAAFLRKPFSLAALVQALKEALPVRPEEVLVRAAPVQV